MKKKIGGEMQFPMKIQFYTFEFVTFCLQHKKYKIVRYTKIIFRKKDMQKFCTGNLTNAT